MLCTARRESKAVVAVMAAAALTVPAASASVEVFDRGSIEMLPQAVDVDFETDGQGQDISIATRGGWLPVAADEYAPLGFSFDRNLNIVHDGYNPFRFAQFLEGAASSLNADTGFNAIPHAAVDTFSILFDAPVRTFGLMVAIPLLITNSVLTAKTGDIVDGLEMASVKALNVISGKARRQVESAEAA